MIDSTELDNNDKEIYENRGVNYYTCELDKIARKYNADKGCYQELSNKWKNVSGLNWTDEVVKIKPGHNYVELYEKYLSHLKYVEFDLLEIGMGNYPTNGYSMRMWLEYFPNARIHVIDINSNNFNCDFEFDESRVRFYQMNQSNVNDLYSFVQNIPVKFDVIIDDGSHIPDDQINSYKILFPNVLNENGIYIIEDLFTSNTTNIQNNFFSFISIELMRLQSGCLINDKNIQNPFDLQSIHFYRSIVFMLKNKNKISM